MLKEVFAVDRIVDVISFMGVHPDDNTFYDRFSHSFEVFLFVSLLDLPMLPADALHVLYEGDLAIMIRIEL